MTQKRILLIDDEAGFTRVLKSYLEGTGRYVVHIENQGAQGPATVSEFNPNLILLDIIMPDLDGRSVAAKIRELPAFKKTPIIFLTATVSPEEEASSKKPGSCQLYLAKPANASEVIAAIEQVLGKDPDR